MNYDITPRQAASRLGRTKEIINSKGPQITVETCPFCHGGQHHDKWTFAIHAETGTYNCKRGTCGASGSYRQLLQHLGLSANYELRPEKPPRKQYKKPETKPEPPDSPQSSDSSMVDEYLMLSWPATISGYVQIPLWSMNTITRLPSGRAFMRFRFLYGR